MSLEITAADRAAMEALLARMERGWNAMDGAAYAAPFAEDADFVTVRGEHSRGRQAIAAGHAGIFATTYAGSRNRFQLESARLLRTGVALAHARSELEAPQGPLAGRHTARCTLVLVQTGTGWEIAALHNTLVAPPPR